ncbi:MAG: site-specific integrase [Deltaproteobacteria bacterium]|jgi:site-specific recombinase XerD|nr:site-specific integrase [Deltaproteobacteria bacterium]
MRNINFYHCLSFFFTEYLPKICNLCRNTITNYRNSINLLFIFCRDVVGVPPEKLTFQILNDKTIIRFLDWLQTEQKSSDRVINQRIAAVRSFFRYAQIRFPRYPALARDCQKILKIPFKINLEKDQRPNMQRLTFEQTQLLLGAPDVETKQGRRDKTLLSLLYDSAARVQELCDLRVKDVRLHSPAIVTLTDKDGETRSVPLSLGVVRLLRSYMAENRHLQRGNPDIPLFANRRRLKLTYSGVSKMVQKHARALAAQGENFAESLTPRVLRISKAMHWYQQGVKMVYLHDWLGNKVISTTASYVRGDLESKGKGHSTLT